MGNTFTILGYGPPFQARMSVILKGANLPLRQERVR